MTVFARRIIYFLENGIVIDSKRLLALVIMEIFAEKNVLIRISDAHFVEKAAELMGNYVVSVIAKEGDIHQAEPLEVDGRNIVSQPIEVPKDFIVLEMQRLCAIDKNDTKNEFYDLWAKYYSLKYSQDQQ